MLGMMRRGRGRSEGGRGQGGIGRRRHRRGRRDRGVITGTAECLPTIVLPHLCARSFHPRVCVVRLGLGGRVLLLLDSGFVMCSLLRAAPPCNNRYNYYSRFLLELSGGNSYVTCSIGRFPSKPLGEAR